MAHEFGGDELPDVLDDESLASADACGEWRYARNDETRVPGEIRVRTGADRWLHTHGRGSREPKNPATALLLCFHNPLEENSRFLSNFRGALGNSSRPHFRDEKSVLLTWVGANPRQLFQQDRYQRYLNDPTIHTAFSFTIGSAQKHTNGNFQSVLPPEYQPDMGERDSRNGRSKPKHVFRPTLIPVVKPRIATARPGPEVDGGKLRQAILKLKGIRKPE